MMKSVEEVLNMTLEEKLKLTNADINDALTPMIKETNKKLRDWYRSEYKDDPPKFLKEFLDEKHLTKDGLITSKGMTLNQKKQLLNQLTRYNKNKTSSVFGFESTERKRAAALGISEYDSWDIKTRNQFWEIINELKNRHPKLGKVSHQLIELAEKIMGGVVGAEKLIGKGKGEFLTSKGKGRKKWGDTTKAQVLETFEKRLGLSSEITDSEVGKSVKARVIEEAKGKGIAKAKARGHIPY